MLSVALLGLILAGCIVALLSLLIIAPLAEVPHRALVLLAAFSLGLAGLERWREIPEASDTALRELLEDLSAGQVIQPAVGPVLINLVHPARPSPAPPAAAARPGALPDR